MFAKQTYMAACTWMKQTHKQTEVHGCDSRVRLGGGGSYLEVRLGQWQQENGLGHGWVAGLEDGQQEGRGLSLQDIRETGRCQSLQGWGDTTTADR